MRLAGEPDLPPLVIHAADAEIFKENFNPLILEGANPGTAGMIYETLAFFNRLKPGEITPWLATKHEWADSGKTLTFTLRTGVKWTDGQPFTADDVACTFDILKRHPELTKGPLELDCTQVLAPHVVRLRFSAPSYIKLFKIAGNQPIVPKHLWERVTDPVSHTNPRPVGTGPYVLSTYSPQLYEMRKNESYWQPGKPIVPSLRFPACSGESVLAGLRDGGIDWAGAYVPDIERIYVQGRPDRNRHYFPPEGLVNLVPNLAHPTLSRTEVRQAISLAIDRDAIVDIAGGGYPTVAHPTGVLMPGGEKYLRPGERSARFGVDRARASLLLEGLTPEELTFSLLVPAEFADWVKAAELIRNDLATVGITVLPDQLAHDEWMSRVSTGRFDLSIKDTPAGHTPFLQMWSMLLSWLAPPVGNFQRWKDEESDSLLADYAYTDDEGERRRAIQRLGRIMQERLPVVPLFYSPSWSQYRTTKYVGWPSKEDPYALPSPYTWPDAGVVLLHLNPATTTAGSSRR
ncbi:ABC transporter substrate-binding protein [Nonomuraea sp. NPDC049709]|uniref:ABC transporter substrate-binding protein n=1 Tax=Nonomuraea sp. NPDC049709 TaxID=3154736 RepID=UPI00341F4E81